MLTLFDMDAQDYDPSGKVYERPTARAIIVKDGRVLLNHVAAYGFYEVPGGGIEAGEAPEAAVIREVAEETGREVIPESMEPFGMVTRRQRDSHDPGGIFEQRSYYYFCEVTGATVPRRPDAHEIEDGASPVWVESLSMPVRINRRALQRHKIPHIEREMRVMDMADEALRRRDYVKAEQAAIASLGDDDYAGMLAFVRQTLEGSSPEGQGDTVMNKLEFGYSRYEHTKRVLGWAKRLYDMTADKTGLRYGDMMIATVFHDVGRAASARLGTDHARAGVPITRDWLLNHGYAADRAEYIAWLVGKHSDKGRMHDPDIDRNLLMLMEADLLDDMGLLGIVTDTLIVRARNGSATFYDCLNHYERYTHPLQHDCPVVTPEARTLWDQKTALTDRFVEQFRRDILIGGEAYRGYR